MHPWSIGAKRVKQSEYSDTDAWMLDCAGEACLKDSRREFASKDEETEGKQRKRFISIAETLKIRRSPRDVVPLAVLAF